VHEIRLNPAKNAVKRPDGHEIAQRRDGSGNCHRVHNCTVAFSEFVEVLVGRRDRVNFESVIDQILVLTVEERPLRHCKGRHVSEPQWIAHWDPASWFDWRLIGRTVAAGALIRSCHA